MLAIVRRLGGTESNFEACILIAEFASAMCASASRVGILGFPLLGL